MPDTRLSNGSKCVKYFLIVGTVLLMLGGLMTIFGSNQDTVVVNLIVGGLSLGIGLAGCLGAIKENTRMLRVFTVSLLFLVIMGILSVVIIFTSPHEFRDMVRDHKRYENTDVDKILKWMGIQILGETLFKISFVIAAYSLGREIERQKTERDMPMRGLQP